MDVDIVAATEALKTIDGVKAEVADRMDCPPTWRLAFGAVMGAMIAGQAGPPPVALAILALAMGAVVLMVSAMRRRMGFFVNGYRRGRTRRVAVGLLVFVESVLAVSLYLKLGRHIWWAPLVGGAIVAPVAVAASYAWQTAYRRDLADGRA